MTVKSTNFPYVTLQHNKHTHNLLPNKYAHSNMFVFIQVKIGDMKITNGNVINVKSFIHYFRI